MRKTNTILLCSLVLSLACIPASLAADNGDPRTQTGMTDSNGPAAPAPATNALAESKANRLPIVLPRKLGKPTAVVSIAVLITGLAIAIGVVGHTLLPLIAGIVLLPLLGAALMRRRTSPNRKVGMFENAAGSIGGLWGRTIDYAISSEMAKSRQRLIEKLSLHFPNWNYRFVRGGDGKLRLVNKQADAPMPAPPGRLDAVAHGLHVAGAVTTAATMMHTIAMRPAATLLPATAAWAVVNGHPYLRPQLQMLLGDLVHEAAHSTHPALLRLFPTLPTSPAASAAELSRPRSPLGAALETLKSPVAMLILLATINMYHTSDRRGAVLYDMVMSHKLLVGRAGLSVGTMAVNSLASGNLQSSVKSWIAKARDLPSPFTLPEHAAAAAGTALEPISHTSFPSLLRASSAMQMALLTTGLSMLELVAAYRNVVQAVKLVTVGVLTTGAVAFSAMSYSKRNGLGDTVELLARFGSRKESSRAGVRIEDIPGPDHQTPLRGSRDVGATGHEGSAAHGSASHGGASVRVGKPGENPHDTTSAAKSEGIHVDAGNEGTAASRQKFSLLRTWRGASRL
ncbi:hypothetical protein SeLEV6574_g07319 [Synchytrium endobioticum]|nr:hypothetical protein SeLEV6574_g07319 [Synchytrium endobioticum]